MAFIASFMVITFFFQNGIINLTNKESIDKNICQEIFFFKEVVLEKK